MKKLFFAPAGPSLVPSLTKWSYESNGSETRAICVPGSVSCGTCRKCRRGYLLLLSFYVIERPSGIQSTSCYITWLRCYNFRNNKWGPVRPGRGRMKDVTTTTSRVPKKSPRTDPCNNEPKWPRTTPMKFACWPVNINQRTIEAKLAQAIR